MVLWSMEMGWQITSGYVDLSSNLSVTYNIWFIQRFVRCGFLVSHGIW